MRLIVASVDDLLHIDATENAATIKQVERLLRQDFVLHFYTLEYWCLHDETDSENIFAVTPLLRRIWQDCFRPEYRMWIKAEEE